MKSLLKTLIITFLLLPSFSNYSNAQSTQAQIEELKKQILEIQRQHQQQIEMLQKKIESLESQRSSDELKVEEFIAKKEAEDEDAWWKSFKAGYDKGFFLESADGNFKTTMNIRGQFRVIVDDVDDEDTVTDFDLARVRLYWKGHAFRPWFKYKLQVDIREDSFNLRDLVFDFAYNKQIVPRVGQYKVPFSREQLTSSSALQFVDRSIVNEFFAFNRDVGVGVHGKIHDMFFYEAGVFQGEGRNADEGDFNGEDSNFLWAGRILFSPIGKDLKFKQNFVKEPTVQIGAAIAGIDSDIVGEGSSALSDETDQELYEIRGGDYAALGASGLQAISWAADIALLHPRANIEAEYIGTDFSPDGTDASDAYDQGFRVQGGVFLIPKVLEIAARYAYIDFDEDVGDLDSLWEITPAISYYLGEHRWKIQADYSFIQEEDIDGVETDENRFRVQLQAYF